MGLEDYNALVDQTIAVQREVQFQDVYAGLAENTKEWFPGLPFDQLPDNFIQGDTLQKAMIEAEPSLAGQIDQRSANQNAQPQVWYPQASVGDFLAAAIR